MSTDEVLAEFAKLPGAEHQGKGDEQFVYIPGTRKDKVLLVAHADTVWKDKKLEIVYNNNYYFSGNKDTGIGADDRAGCRILWQLRNMGHSVLVTNAEECGCKGSRFLMGAKDYALEMNTHRFAMQFDRKNAKNLVYYDVGTDDFNKWLETNMKGYKRDWGSSTDIKVLCDTFKHDEDTVLCGVNVSTGYYDEHGSRERLNIADWNSTLSHAYKLLSGNDIPRFAQKKYRYNSSGSSNYSPNVNTTPKVVKVVGADKAILSELIESITICPHCGLYQDESEIISNNDKCSKCNKEIKVTK
jgi:hypothetical protein